MLQLEATIQTSRIKCEFDLIWLIWYLVFNATFSNISIISLWPVLVVEEAKVPGENHRGQTTGKLYHLRLRVECTLFVIYKAGREPTPQMWDVSPHQAMLYISCELFSWVEAFFENIAYLNVLYSALDTTCMSVSDVYWWTC